MDWIGDMLYVVETRGKKIWEYNLHSAEKRIVVSTGTSMSRPIAITVYPYPGQG